jgi:hypothetical protein
MRVWPMGGGGEWEQERSKGEEAMTVHAARSHPTDCHADRG